MAEPAGPVLVVIPTYNERENLEPSLARMHAVVPDAQVLVVDDGSPDGTGELADKLAADDARVRVLHRTAKEGLGAAYMAGFAVALQGEHQVIVEMDADGSHAPEDLPALLAALEPDADVVLGSRYVPGGKVVNWPAHRELDVAGRQPVLPARAGGADPRHHRRVPRVPPRGARDARPCTRSSRRATASRSTSRGGRCSPGSASSRCRSPSPNASGARRR